MRARLLGAAAFWSLLWLPPVRSFLERDMAIHMTVQMPLLILIGWIAGGAFRRREPRWLADADWLGVSGLMLVVFTTSFWMLPRAMDGAIADPFVDLAKFVSLSVLAGMPLRLSWVRMPWLGKAFLWANFIPKLAAIGALYLAAPTRLCAYYGLGQQAFAGCSLIAIATILGIYWLAFALIGPSRIRSRRYTFSIW